MELDTFSCKELVAKLGSDLDEVRDRAMKTVCAKLEGGLLSPKVLGAEDGLAQLLLHWINDRQSSAAPQLVRQALRLIAALASVPQAATALHDAACLVFLQDFLPHATIFLSDVNDAINALLAHPAVPNPSPVPGAPSLPAHSNALQKLTESPTFSCAFDVVPTSTLAERDQSSVLVGNGREEFGSFTRALTSRESPFRSAAQDFSRQLTMPRPIWPTPAKSSRSKAWEPTALSDADAQLLMDLGVRMRFCDVDALVEACEELVDFFADLPAFAMVEHPQILEGLARSLQPLASCSREGALRVRLAGLVALRALLKGIKVEMNSREASSWSIRLDRLHSLGAEQRYFILCGALGSFASSAEPDVRSVSVLHDICLLVGELGAGECGSGDGFSALDPAQLGNCLKLVGGALEIRLLSQKKWLYTLREALESFRDLGLIALASVEDAACFEESWGEPLWTHEWNTELVAFLHIFSRLLTSLKASSSSARESDLECLSDLLRVLLFDPHLIFEHLGVVAVLADTAMAVSPALAAENDLFSKLLRSLVPFPHSGSSAPTCSWSRLSDGSPTDDSMIRRIVDLESRACWLTSGLRSSRESDLVSDLLALMKDLSCTEAGESLEDTVATEVRQNSLRRVVALAARLAVAPIESIQIAFFDALEQEVGSEWLLLRCEFRVLSLLHGGERGLRCVSRQRSTGAVGTSGLVKTHLRMVNIHEECGVRSDLEECLISELEEAICVELLPTSLSTCFRRIFLAEPRSRRDAGVSLWRSSIGSSALSPLLCSGDVWTSLPSASEFALDSFYIAGMSVVAKDLEHPLAVLASRLSIQTRSAALVQLATFAASDPQSSNALLPVASANAVLLLLDALRTKMLREYSAPGFQRSTGATCRSTCQEDSEAAIIDFLVRSCQAGAVLMLIGHPSSWVTQQFHNHRDAFLDRLAGLIFEEDARLRLAAMQFAACLLFHYTFTNIFASKLGNVFSTRLSLVCLKCLSDRYVWPLPCTILATPGEAPAPPAVQFWAETPPKRMVALCQLFRSLGAAGLDLSVFGDMPSCELLDCSGDGLVLRGVEGTFAKGASAQDVESVACSLCLVRPLGAHLLKLPSFVLRVFDFRCPVVAVGASKLSAEPRSLVDYGNRLDLVCRVLSTLPPHAQKACMGSGCSESSFLRGLERVADAVVARLLPVLQRVLQPLGPVPGTDGVIPSMDTWGANSPVRVRLSANKDLRRFTELCLRVELLLAQRQELSLRWLAPSEWIGMLALLSCAGTASIRRLALAVACKILPQPLNTKCELLRWRLGGAASGGNGADIAVGTNPGNAVLAEALFHGLMGLSLCTVSLRYSFEWKARLWLVSRGARPRCCSVFDSIRMCLSHHDVFVRIFAWRACSELCKASVSGQHSMKEATEIEHAIRVLRLCSFKLGSTSTSELLHWAEVLNYLCAIMDTARTCGEHERQNAYIMQIVHAGIVEGDALQVFFASGIPRFQRSAVRLLRSMLEGGGPEAQATRCAMFNAGIWLKILAGVAWPPESAVDLFVETCALTGDIALLVGIVAASEPQIVLWLATAGPFLTCWQTSLLALSSASGPAVRESLGQVADTIIVCHLKAIAAAASAVKIHACGLCPDAQVSTLTASDASVDILSEFLGSAEVAALLIDAFQGQTTVCTRRLSACALGLIAGLRLAGVSHLGRGSCFSFSDDVLGRSASECWLWEIASHQELLAEGQGKVLGDESLCIARCLTNLLGSSREAATAAWKAGLLGGLLCHISFLSAQLPLPGPREKGGLALDTGQQLLRQQNAARARHLVWSLRVLGALLVSSSEALGDSIREQSASKERALDQRNEYPDSSTKSAGAPQLAIGLLAIRDFAEKDDAVCLEMLELLIQCLCVKDWGDRVSTMLFQRDLIPWMIRLSTRQSLSIVIYCKVMRVLSHCAGEISGKPILSRFLCHLARSLRAHPRSVRRMDKQVSKEELSENGVHQQRLLATLNFMASVRYNAALVELILAAPTSAHLLGTGAAMAHGCVVANASTAACLGIDFWLDLVDPKSDKQVQGVAVRLAPTIRLAALRVLLAALSGSPHAKGYFMSSVHAVTVLLSMLRMTTMLAVQAVVLRIVWVLAYNNQRALPMLKRVGAPELISQLSSAQRNDASATEDQAGSFVLEQLRIIFVER